ncbi:hypothetical protein D3C75_780620 [compost metagenome]
MIASRCATSTCHCSRLGTGATGAWYKAKLMPSWLVRMNQRHWPSSWPWSGKYSWPSTRGARQVNGACGVSASSTQASLVVLLLSSSTSWRSELVR